MKASCVDDINISNNNYGKITKTVAQSVPGPVNTDPEIVYGKPEELVTSPEPPVMVFPQSPDEDIAQSNLGDGFVPSTNYLSPSNEPVPSTNFLSTSNEPASNYLSPSNEPATNYLSPSNEPASNYLSPPNEPVTTVTQTSYVSR